MGKKFLKPVPVLIATLLAAGAFASGGSAVEAANLVGKKETEQSENKQLLLQPADSDETVFLGHRSHSSHASHASHHSHYSGFVGE